MNHDDHVNLLRNAGLPPGGCWGDLGAGTGAFTLALRELVGAEAVVYAVDRDPRSLRELEHDWRMRFGGIEGLHLVEGDFTRPLNLPPLDGVIMANSLHFYPDPEARRQKSSKVQPPDKLAVLQQVGVLLRPGGRLLLVEYDVDSGNSWVPHPLSFQTCRALLPQAGFRQPRLLATHPSSFLRGFYSAASFRL